ncbi:Degenerin del-1, partial [Toxocara canis]
SQLSRMSLFRVILKNVSKDLGRTVKSAADGELRSEFSTFAQTTSAHGIPMAVVARRMSVKAFWLCLTFSLFLYFIYQCTLVLEKYRRNDKIVNVELDAFHQAVTYSKDAANQFASGRNRRSNEPEQYPGGFRYVQFEPVLSDCECPETNDRDCKQKDTVPSNNYSYGKYCLLRPERLKRIWEFRGKAIPDKASPFRADFLEQLKQLGYENMTDEVAITIKTKERLVLTMAGLPVHRRIALSYGKSEFIHMCSFNGQQCDIISDFKLHVDPAFGNCYTFNANRKNPLVSSRAGPSYGLRLMVFVNATDYLPTTEATGVRIAIHGHDEYPFPDTFGYSAPTGAVSSFGLSMATVLSAKESASQGVTRVVVIILVSKMSIRQPIQLPNGPLDHFEWGSAKMILKSASTTIGASVITLLEVIIFVFRILTIYCRRNRDANKSKLTNGFTNANQLDSNGIKPNDSSCAIDTSVVFEVNRSDEPNSENGDQDDQNANYHNDNKINSLNENHYEVS